MRRHHQETYLRQQKRLDRANAPDEGPVYKAHSIVFQGESRYIAEYHLFVAVTSLPCSPRKATIVAGRHRVNPGEHVSTPVGPQGLNPRSPSPTVS